MKMSTHIEYDDFGEYLETEELEVYTGSKK